LEANPQQAYLAYEMLEDLYFASDASVKLKFSYRQIIEKAAGGAAGRAGAGSISAQERGDRGALEVCRRIVERHPEDVWARRFMIRTLLEGGRTGEIGPLAVEVLDRVMLDKRAMSVRSADFRRMNRSGAGPRCSALGAF